MTRRRISQISAGKDSGLYALCDDGTLWVRWEREWHAVEPVPQASMKKPERDLFSDLPVTEETPDLGPAQKEEAK